MLNFVVMVFVMREIVGILFYYNFVTVCVVFILFSLPLALTEHTCTCKIHNIVHTKLSIENKTDNYVYWTYSLH